MKKTNHRRILKIGNQLADGPNAIFRISRGDWLEKDLQIVLYEPGMKKIESYSIWSDDSMNKENDFLPPMIRIFTWNRREDLENLKIDPHRDFPNVNVQLGLIKSSNTEKVNSNFISFQNSILKNLNYIPYQIPQRRDSADIGVNYKDEYIDYSIYFRNGEQSLEFNSSGNVPDDIIIREVLRMKDLLNESIEPVNKNFWKERYYELTNDYIEGEITEWYYKNEL